MKHGWERDAVLAVWTRRVEATHLNYDSELRVSRKGRGRNLRYSWRASLDFVPRRGVDTLEGQASRLDFAQQQAEKALRYLGRTL